ncbi:hypothetical protein HanIR_Chr11g0545941 [Helianthus annuus]|nr:hypothetical protein HanIR_Chr11g0545941 [Helianthus annuus]
MPKVPFLRIVLMFQARTWHISTYNPQGSDNSCIYKNMPNNINNAIFIILFLWLKYGLSKDLNFNKRQVSNTWRN